METQENTVMAERRARTTTRARFGLMTMLLSLLVFVTGAAQASPQVADYYLQRTKYDFTLEKTYYQIGRNYALARNAAAARPYFLNAYSNSIAMQIDAERLYAENLINLQGGMYRNAAYQQMAVQQSNVLRTQVQLLSAYLNLLAQQPLNTGAILTVDTQIVQVTATLYATEQYMRSAQL